jgi:hypothetical protein
MKGLKLAIMQPLNLIAYFNWPLLFIEYLAILEFSIFKGIHIYEYHK